MNKGAQGDAHQVYPTHKNYRLDDSLEILILVKSHNSTLRTGERAQPLAHSASRWNIRRASAPSKIAALLGYGASARKRWYKAHPENAWQRSQLLRGC